MAKASGLTLVPPEKRNPRHTTTYGTGELILHALDRGIKKLIIGLGGSATNDGGAGMLTALGLKLLDQDGRELAPGGEALLKLAKIDPSCLDPRIAGVEIQVACDVTNPLCGPEGASAVYGPQKGAGQEDVLLLDQALAHFAHVVEADLGQKIKDLPGAGAAGGLGAALLLLGGELKPGAPLIIEAAGIPALLTQVDLVITGEGKIDGQTSYGKLPLAVGRLGKARHVPVVAVTGYWDQSGRSLVGQGLDAVYAIADQPMNMETAFSRTAELLRDAGEQIYRLASLGR